VPRVSAEVLEHLTSCNFIKIDVVVFSLGGQPQASTVKPLTGTSLLRATWRLLTTPIQWKHALFNAYDRWDRRNVAAKEDPLAHVDCSKYLTGLERIDVTPLVTKSTHRFPPDVIERVRARNLDVLIRFGSSIIRGDILTAAKHGVWSYHHGDNDAYRGGPSYFWETLEGNPLCGVVVQKLTEELDAGAILYKGLFSTESDLSYRRTGVRPYWGSTTFMVQKLNQLHERGWESVERQIVPKAPYTGRKRVYRLPSNGEMVRWLGGALSRKVVNRLTRRTTMPYWRLGVRVNGTSLLNAQTPDTWQEFRWANSPRGRFYADPFLTEHCGQPWVFFEDADLDTWHGVITAAPIQPNGDLGEPVPVLRRPYHLSYPVMIHEGSDCFMMPETLSIGAVELWRCTKFPGEWTLEKTLFTGRAVDTTLWIEDGTYWFFVTLRERYGGATQLWLFYADSLTGDWTPHPVNPITTDCRRSRGAGAIFRAADGRRVRPSQDSTRSYGRQIMMNEIVTLDRERYEERPLATIEAPPGFAGTHTYGRLGNIEIVDAWTPMSPKVLGAHPPDAAPDR
jgi:hypothetical protein